MSQEIRNDDEIDLGQLLKVIKGFLINLLKGLISIIYFYKKKALLFVVLLIVGAIGGYFLDKKLKTNKEYRQEIIIEPNYESTNLIYNFINELNHNFRDSIFLNRYGLKPENFENLKEISLEPLYRYTDVLQYFNDVYGEKDAHHSISELDPDLLESDEYKNFYKRHKLTLKFSSEIRNDKIVNAILNCIKSNDYYKNLVTLSLNQLKFNLEKNHESLVFIDQYLANLKTSGSIPEKKEIFVLAGESETPTIASLLKQKATILSMIQQDEKLLKTEKEVLLVVENTGLIIKNREVFKRMFFIFPLLLCGLVSLFYFMIFIFDWIKRTVEKN